MSNQPSSEQAAGGGRGDIGPLGDEATCALSSPPTEDAACLITPPPPGDQSNSEEDPEAGDKRGATGEARTGRLAALIYTGISSLAAALFIVATTLMGDYPDVARYGGAAWVFVLTMIVLMPFVIPRVRKWRG